MKLLLDILVITSLMTVMESLDYTFGSRITGEMKNRIEAVYRGETSGEALPFKAYEKIKGNYKKGEASAEDVKITEISNGFAANSSQAKVVLTDENYLNFFPGISIIKGIFISDEACKNEESVLVISRELANTLFNRTDVIGNTVIISERKYKIIGVYKEHKTLMGNITGDGLEKVFIPYTSGEKNESVERLLVNGLQYKDGIVYSFEDAINRISKTDAAKNYYISDFSDCEAMVGQSANILLFVLGVCCIVLIVKRLLKLFKGFGIYYKMQLENKYLPAALRDNILHIGIFIGITCIYIFLLALVYKLASFDFYIPSKYIPHDNVFDLKFYFGRIASAIHESNTFFKINYASFNALLKSSLKIELLLAVLIVIFASDLVFCLKVIGRFKIRGIKTAVHFFAALSAGVAAGCVAAGFMGLTCNLPGKYLVCMFLLLLLCGDNIFMKKTEYFIGHNVNC